MGFTPPTSGQPNIDDKREVNSFGFVVEIGVSDYLLHLNTWFTLVAFLLVVAMMIPLMRYSSKLKIQ